MARYDLLYIAFIDLQEPVDSGSGVRPQQMLRAFQNLGYKIKVLDGWNNKRKQRRERVHELLRWIDENEVDYCYVEPPAGPYFVSADLRLLNKLHKKGVTIGLFYRDIFWRFQSLFGQKEKLKFQVVRWMHQRDLFVFKRTVDFFYFPSQQMAEFADFGVPYCPLPPAAEKLNVEEMEKQDIARLAEEKPLNIFYVGGITGIYGLSLLYDAVRAVNRESVRVRLHVICRENEWQEFQSAHDVAGYSWFRVSHESHGDGLEEQYQEVDIAALAMRNTAYTRFAVNVKLYEYVAHLKPVLSTNPEAIAEIVGQNQIGWVCEDTAESIQKQLEHILENRQEILEIKKKQKIFLEENTWESRARKVMETLQSIRREK